VAVWVEAKYNLYGINPVTNYCIEIPVVSRAMTKDLKFS